MGKRSIWAVMLKVFQSFFYRQTQWCFFGIITYKILSARKTEKHTRKRSAQSSILPILAPFLLLSPFSTLRPGYINSTQCWCSPEEREAAGRRSIMAPRRTRTVKLPGGDNTRTCRNRSRWLGPLIPLIR